MSNLAPASGGLSRRAAAPTSGEAGRTTRSAYLSTTILLLVITGIASLILCEQILTGWLALGERANIPRSNLNAIELAVAAGTLIWGLATLRTAYAFVRHERVASMEDYFNGNHTLVAPGVLLTVLLLGIIGGLSLLLAEQVLTGWLALGERVNIPRSNLNGIEISVIISAGIWGFVTLRTVYGILVRDRRAWATAQWVVLLTAIIGMAVLLSGTFDIYTIIPPGGSVADNLGGVQELTGPGLLLFLSSVAVYRYMTIGVDTTAAQRIRNSLSKTPGAGAIIGFFAIAAIFALASDLFLEPRSLAGLLATNITRGIVAIGVTFLMISGEFDLSVGSVYGAGALVFLLMMTEGLALGVLFGVPLAVIGIALIALGSRGRAPLSIAGLVLVVLSLLALLSMNQVIITTVIPAAIIALIFAAILGFINGGILILTGIPSFIVTLGTLLAYRAILLVVVADGRILRYADYRLPDPFIYISRWIIIIGAVALALAVVFMGISLLRGAWNGLRERLARYQTDMGDFRDFFVVVDALRLLIVAAVVIAAVVGLGVVVVNQFNAVGSSPVIEVSFFDLMNGRFDFVDRDVNLRAGVIWWLLLVIVFQFILTNTPYGNHVLAVGGNPGAARAQGINVNMVKILNFVISAVLACLAGIINVSRLANVDPLMGDGLELEVIAASVIGGALLTGGYGSIFGALLGVLIFGMLQTGLVLVGVDSRAFSGVIGIIIIIAVVINTAVRQARK